MQELSRFIYNIYLNSSVPVFPVQKFIKADLHFATENTKAIDIG